MIKDNRTCTPGTSYQLHTGTIEVWRYDRPSPQPPLLLYFVNKPFQGSVEPNVLVPTLLAEDPGTRAQLCDIDPALCPKSPNLYPELVSGAMSLMHVGASRLKGLEYIKEAVTSDRFLREFAGALHPSMETHVLDLAQGGSPRLIVAFALPGNEIKNDSIGAGKGFFYPIRIQVMASHLSDGARVEMDTLRSFAMPHTLRKGEYLSGLVELPLPPGKWTASVIITQPDNRGALGTLKEIIAPSWTTRLELSDLVLGRDEVGLRWNSGPGGQAVALNPLNTFPEGASASVYAQVSGLTPGEQYNATIELFEGSEAKGKPTLTIALPETAVAARAELSRKLGLTNLKPGRYLVRLTIRSGGETAVTTGGLEIKN